MILPSRVTSRAPGPVVASQLRMETKLIPLTLLLLTSMSAQASGPLTCEAVFKPTTTSAADRLSQAATSIRKIPYETRSFRTPITEQELVSLVRGADGPISVLGGGYSMGGQVGTRGGVTIDMSKYNSIIDVNKAEKTITVQAGATWRQIQEVIHRNGLAIKVMQSYNNFQVGGSLSVNVHGRYVGFGPIISTVRELKVLLADGRVVTASRTQNADLFSGVIGGYGGLGIIIEAKLDLADNVKVERQWQEFTNKKGDFFAAAQDYVQHFRDAIAADPDAVFTNADIYPPDYSTIRSITYKKTNKPLTVQQHLQDPKKNRWDILYVSTLTSLEQLFSYVKRYREKTYEPQNLEEEKVVMRNWEASADVDELIPLNERFPILKRIFGFSNRKAFLQEYFIPVDQMPAFLMKMKGVFQKHNVNVTNVSIRHVPKNTESLLSWSRVESFALVIYYSEPLSNGYAVETAVGRAWTQEILDHVIATGGTYYLPYQLHARTDQFRQAYPQFGRYQQLKQKYDPTGKFSNYFVDTYVAARESFNFKSMLESEFEQIEMMEFFRNVFGIINPEQHMKAITTAYAELKAEEIQANDRNMYERIQKILPKYAGNPVVKGVRGIKSLRTQQVEMSGQTAGILARSGKTDFNGYVEIGTPGRYVGYLKGSSGLSLMGPTYVVNEVKPGLASPIDILERTGGFGILDPRSYTSTVARSKFVDLNDYDMISQTEIPNASVDLVSVFIGLHHAPPHKLRQFVASINRIMRTDGRFVLRDHDVNSPELNRMAQLAHSTFNAGLGATYEAEVRDIRNFHSVDYWVQLLRESGFELASNDRVLQAGDPTRNTLLVFKKVGPAKDGGFQDTVLGAGEKLGRDNLKSINGYFRSGTHTYMVSPEWFWVDVYEEYASFQARQPWYLFPFDKYLELSKKVYAAHRDYAMHRGIDDQMAFEEYDKMDRALILSNGVLFKGLALVAKFTKWSLRKEVPPQTTGFVVQNITPDQIGQFSTGLITEMTSLRDNMILLATQRQMPFTKAMIELAIHEDVKLLEVAGNTDINVLFSSTSHALPDYIKAISSVEEIISYDYPTEISSKGAGIHFHSVKVHVSQLGAMLRALQAHNAKVMRVHDF